MALDRPPTARRATLPRAAKPFLCSALFFAAACGGDRGLIPTNDVMTDMPNARDTYVPPFDVPTATDVPVRRDVPTFEDVPTAMMDGSDAVSPPADGDSGLVISDVSDTGVRTDVPSADVPNGPDVVDAAAPPPRCTPTIDGTINAAEWQAGYFATNTALPSIWGPNELRDLRMCFDDNALYIAVRGTVEAAGGANTGNAIVLYVDRDYQGPARPALGISLLSSLNDRAGQLDNALSGGIALGAGTEGFGVEAAFGIAGMRTFTSPTSEDNQGWRLFWPAGGMPDRRRDFAFVLNGVNTSCQDRAGIDMDTCETRILWTSLFEGPRPATTSIAVFARIVNNDGSMSPNQTLPQDDPMMPRTVHRLGVIEVR